MSRIEPEPDSPFAYKCQLCGAPMSAMRWHDGDRLCSAECMEEVRDFHAWVEAEGLNDRGDPAPEEERRD